MMATLPLIILLVLFVIGFPIGFAWFPILP